MQHQYGQDTLVMRNKKKKLSNDMRIVEADMRRILNITDPDPEINRGNMDTSKFY